MATLKLTEKNVAALAVPVDTAQSYHWDTEQRGFGVVVGRSGARTFVARGRVNGQLVKRTIGQFGQVRSDGRLWTVLLARQEARSLLGQLAGGKDPGTATERRAKASGPTLREGLELHLASMRDKLCSARSIHKIETEVPRHLEDWLDRPIVEMTAEDLRAVADRIKKNATPIAGAVNVPGAAQAKKTIAHVSAIWNTLDRLRDLPVKNPAKRLEPSKMKLKPRVARIDDGAFTDWYAKVQAMTNQVRRDLQLVSLFTGIRSDGVRNLRWEDVDVNAELLQVQRAKGDKPYTLPLVATVREILDRRRADNAVTFQPWGGDHGFVFPSLSRDAKRVQAVAEVKERTAALDSKGKPKRDENGEPIRVQHLPGIHANRRTFNSVAMEIGVPAEARLALMNHEGKGVNVKHYGRPQNWDYLRSEAQRVEAALWQRLKPSPSEKRRGKLRAV